MTNRQRKIVFVNRVYAPSEAATAQLLTDLATGLVQRGWEVHVITAGSPPASKADEDPTTRPVQVHWTGGSAKHGGMVSRVSNYAGFLRAARRTLKRIVSRGDVVVLMTDPPLLAAACTGIARRRAAHVVQWIQDIYPEVAVEHLGRWAVPAFVPMRFARNRAWRASDACVVVGSDMKRALDEAGISGQRSLVLQNWAPREVDRAAEPTHPDATRAAWGLPGEFVIAYSGNLGRVHEFDTVLDAAEHLRDQADIAFLFIGEGARRAEVEREAQARGLKNVRFLGPQPRAKLAASLAAADAHFVTLRDGFQRWVNPSKLPGILAAAKPVIFVGPTDSAISVLVAREGCGRHFPIGAGRELANEIESLAAEPATMSALGRAARQAYERYFSFDAALTCWDEMLRRIAG